METLRRWARSEVVAMGSQVTFAVNEVTAYPVNEVTAASRDHRKTSGGGVASPTAPAGRELVAAKRVGSSFRIERYALLA
jgi:hypothetical protein